MLFTGITLYSHPYGGALLNEDKILESIRQCGVALCIVLGFSILSASIGSSVVRDRVTGAKRLQHISGLGYRTYWFTHFLYDMLFYLVSVCLCVAIITAFQLTAFTFRENLAATALLLALFGYATLPWMYLMSRIFSSSDVAFISYISLNFIFGLCTMLMTTMPRILATISKAQNLQNIYDVLKWVFTIFPQFCLGQGLIELCYNQIKYDLTHNFGIDSYVSPFEMDFLGWIFVELASQGTILLLLRILLHWDLLHCSRGHSTLQGTVKSLKDIDVEKEQMRVLEGRTSGDILVLNSLSKCYGRFFKKTTAVQDISLGIPRGECFGLLGVNGAGKSTTFKVLNGEVPPSSGHAVVRTPTGEEVDLSSAGKAGVLIGYCPQQDALDELLTGWEHLQYYCSLRGIPKQCIPEVAGDLVRRLHLEAHVEKPVSTYSGGTKRKLSTALALVGKPDILLLDEPSSGMDPCSKRYLWQTIMKETREGCAVVLTSHSMEECEALCTRLAIMVNGSFQCLGSPQHIRNSPRAIGPYNQVLFGRIIYISGQKGTNPSNGQLVPGREIAETKHAFMNTGENLRAAGCDITNVVKATVLPAAINDFNTVSEICKQCFKSSFPARWAYQVAALPKGEHTEIEELSVQRPLSSMAIRRHRVVLNLPLS
ncbi:ATP-binding cassette sub-family A member 13 [Sciurus carolinensis]|uniref:ATP-binding cassette sub-family A member 13 n=1 Tax=Sciurus carolinensis TaxID=30640 RepID=A0AA41MKY7_SCICA|nr:ATP-binding cassette sub-family A member 13 [Sciurus carolinensis]